MHFKLNRYAGAAALCLLIFHVAPAQTASGPTNEQIVAKADEYMKAAVNIDRFNGSILVARDGSPVVSKGYGMANIEWDIPNSSQTAFRLGSITKQFTATAIMMLQERGKLNVADPVCKYVTDCPAAWQPITIRHLLTHTAGIPNYTAFPGLMQKKAVLPISVNDLMGEYKVKTLDFAPGEKMSYSNSGYHLLGAIIERASGKPYADFLQENIFTPLALKQTGYDTHRSIIKNRAAGYARDGDALVNAAYLDMLIPYAAGSLYSTTEDLLKWEQSLYTDKLLTRKSFDEMFTPFKNGYGYGWGVGKRLDRQTISHGGGIFGFSTYITRFPAERVTVIVLSNVQGTSTEKVAGALSAIVFGAPYKIPVERKAIAVASSTLDKYVGEYQVAPNLTITVTNENGKLMSFVTGQPKTELFAETETGFFLKTVDAQITFVKNAEGKVTGLLLHQGGRDTQATKK